MKKSEELKALSEKEDNDFKSLKLLCEAKREERRELFIEKHLPALKKAYGIQIPSEHCFTIVTQNKGIIDYFPKSNKVLIRDGNRWKNNGMLWIERNLLLPNEA